jgi:hypothetical protein
MFDHLLSLQIETEEDAQLLQLDEASSAQLLNALHKSASKDNPFAAFGVPSDDEIDHAIQTRDAREAFVTLITEPEDEPKKLALTTIKTPEAVQHLVASLTAYDWEFIEHAKSIRGKIVAQLLEDMVHPTPSVRLKAMKMLGEVTEVALFTTKVEVTSKIEHSEEELNAKVADRLKRLLDATVVAEAGGTPSPVDAALAGSDGALVRTGENQ